MTQEERKQILGELASAWAATPAAELGPWSGRTVKNLGVAASRRIHGLAVLPIKIVSGIYGVACEATLSACHGELLRYLKQSATAAGETAGETAKGAKQLMQIVSRDPKLGAQYVAAMVLGFYAGSGGLDGDGGIPDLDLALGGIGAHRSIFTHSMVAGVLVECATLAFLDLIDIIYFYLPQQHHAFWERAMIKADGALSLASVSVSAGLAYHFLIDSTIDNGKAYSDLPFSLPLEMHQAIMLVNAIGEGNAAAAAAKGVLERQQALDASIVRLEIIASSKVLDARKKRNRLESLLRLLRELYRVDKSIFDDRRVERLKSIAAASTKSLIEAHDGSGAGTTTGRSISFGRFRLRFGNG